MTSRRVPPNFLAALFHPERVPLVQNSLYLDNIPDKIADKMDELAQRVQNLPPELFNNVYELVFTANPATIEITDEYQPPHLLRVSKHSRKMFARSYYGKGTVFLVQGKRRNKLMKRWTASVSQSRHFNMLYELRYVSDRKRPWDIERTKSLPSKRS